MIRPLLAIVRRDIASLLLPIAIVVGFFLLPATAITLTIHEPGVEESGRPPIILGYLFPARMVASFFSMVFLAACFDRLLVNETRTGSIATLLRSPLSARQVLAAKFLSIAVAGALLMLGPALVLCAVARGEVAGSNPILVGLGTAYAMWAGALGILLVAMLASIVLTGLRALPQMPLRGPLAAAAALSVFFTYLWASVVRQLLGLFGADPSFVGSVHDGLIALSGLSPLHAMADLLPAAFGVSAWQPPWPVIALIVALFAVAWPVARRLYVDRIAPA